MFTYRVSELVASTNKVLILDNGRRSFDVDFLNNSFVDSVLTRLCSPGLPADSGLSLHFEHLRSDESLPVIDIYLNLERIDRPDNKNYVDSMSLYGIVESTVEGSGQDRVYEMEEVFARVCGQAN